MILQFWKSKRVASKLLSVISSVCMLCAIAPTVSADDLMSLWAVALEKDSKYLTAKHQYLANREGVKQARSSLLPTLSFQYEYKRVDQEIHYSDNAIFSGGSDEYPVRSMGFTLTQSLFDYGRWQSFYQSKVSEDKSEAEFKLARQELLLRLAENYFLVLEYTDQLQTVQSEKAAMSKHLTLAEKKLNSGLGKRVDVEDANARYLNALSKEVGLESRLLDSRFALREIIGVTPEKISTLNDAIELSLPEPSNADEWVQMSLKHNLRLQVARFSHKEAEREVQAMRSGHYPTLDLIYNDKNTETDGSVFGGGSDITNAELAIQLNVPIYKGGSVSSKVKQAVQKQYGAQEQLNEIQRNVERTANDAFYRINAAIIQIKALAQAVTAQERMLQAKSSGYRTGRNNILEMLDVQQDLSQAQQALTKARYDYVLNILKLKFAAGELGESDLVGINHWLVSL